MSIPMVIFLVCAVIAVQVWVCMKTSRLLLRMLPAVVLTLVEVVLWMIFLFSADSGTAAFAVVIYSVVLMILLLADLLGWGIYALVKFVQKKKE